MAGRLRATLGFLVRALTLPALLVLAGPAGAEDAYVPYSGIERGIEGTEPATLTVQNATAEPLACTAALAHWYSAPLGQAAPGGRLTVRLRHDPETGALALLNEGQDRMPLEGVTCGPPDAPHAARLALPFRAGLAPALAYRCAGGGDALACDRLEGAE